MRSSYLVSVLVLLLAFTTPLLAQHLKKTPEIWLSAGWGGGDGNISEDDYSIFSIGARIHLAEKEQLLILRGELGQDPFLKKGIDYKLQEVKAMWGFSKSFPESNIYGALGLSYAHHRIRDKSIPDQGPLPEPSFRDKTIWGLPLELGTHIKLSNSFSLGGAGFINLNPSDIYVGYLVQLHLRIF